MYFSALKDTLTTTTLQRGFRRPFRLMPRNVPGHVLHQDLALGPVGQALHACHYSRRTDKAQVRWIVRSVLCHDKRHAREMGEPQVTRFPSHLATQRRVSASTQNQRLSALLFLCKESKGRSWTG